MVNTNNYIKFTNDFMFCSVLENTELCKEFLQRVLGIKITKITCVCKQKHIKNTFDAKGIRLDIYVTDINGNSYDIEMQTTSQADLPLRIRYYHSEMDAYALDKGLDYNKLGKNIVIFVCTFDPFGYGDSLYSFRNTCQEHKELLLEDKIETIILNVNGSHNNLNQKLVNLLDYIKTGNTNDSYTQKLESKVYALNTNTIWRGEYMTFEWKLKEREQLGREEGRILLLLQQIKKVITNSIPLETALPILGEDVETIKPIYDLVMQYGIDYSDEEYLKMIKK